MSTQSSESHHTVRINDTDEWIASLESKMKESPTLLSQNAGKSACCIFRVPQSLAEINTKAYQPHIVSIGPLHQLSFLPVDDHVDDSKKVNPSVIQLFPSAKKLHLAGVKFRPRKNDSFLEIKFNRGILEIPLLTLDDFTSSVVMNFVAFEQCSSHCSNHITTYVAFMGCLVNTPGDAGFLCDQKVVENYYGTEEEVARFFNNVRKDVGFDIRRSYLEKEFKEVYEYSRNSWHVRWAGFKHTYFDTPWSFVSALAAIVLLLLTMIQAFFAAYAYAYPPN